MDHSYGYGSQWWCPSNDHTPLSSTSSSPTATFRGPAEQPAHTSLELTVLFFPGSAKQSAHTAKTRPRRPIGPAKQTVALFSHTSTTRPIRRSNGPAKQTVTPFLFPSTQPSRRANLQITTPSNLQLYTYNYLRSWYSPLATPLIALGPLTLP